MENNSIGGFWWGVILTSIVISIVWGIGSNGKYESETAMEWYNKYQDSSSQLEEYKSALSEANDNIEQANSNIDEAKSNESGSYDDMETALSNLETVDTVSNP